SRVVVVTGAGGTGCGRAIAAHFGAGGAAVVVSDINEAGGHETVRVIERAGGRAAFFRADVRRESEARALVSFAEATFGGLHVLIKICPDVDLRISQTTIERGRGLAGLPEAK